METKNKLTVTRGEGAGGQWEKKGEGSGQGTCIKDPWAKTTGGGRFGYGRWGVGRAGENNEGKMGNCN